MAALGALLGRSWPLLGRSWPLLGRSWGALGRSWGALGRSWGALGALLGALGPLLGAVGPLLERHAKINPKLTPKMIDLGFQKPPKMGPGRPSGPSQASPERPRSAQGHHDAPKTGPRAPQERPRAPQERPKSAQERPKSAQERPKSAPRAPWRLPRRLSRRSGEPSGTILTLTSSKKERSESDLLRDSLAKPVRRDFLSIFEACAQERLYEKPVKT